MSKKDKKIEIQLADAKVAINNANVDEGSEEAKRGGL